MKNDPSRTATIRRRFLEAVDKKFRIFKKRLRALVETEDAFGLKKKTLNEALLSNSRYAFLTDEKKLEKFEQWLAKETGEIMDSGFWEEFVEKGHAKGQGRAVADVMQKHPGTKRVLGQAFGKPVAVDKVKFMARRVYTELKGVTDTMSQQLSRGLAEGIAAGESPRVVARSLAKTVDNLQKRRANVIARTETVRAHAEGQLDALEAMGVEQVNVDVEWSTAGDDRVCPLCQPMEAVTLSLKEARGILPRHPNCRCAFIPALPEVKNKRLKRGASAQKQLDKSILAERPKKSKRSLTAQRKKSRWQGADVNVKVKRAKAAAVKRKK